MYLIKLLGKKKALNLLHPVFPDTKDLMCFTKLCDMFIVAKSLWQIRIFIILKKSALIPQSGGAIQTSTPQGHKGHLYIGDFD